MYHRIALVPKDVHVCLTEAILNDLAHKAKLFQIPPEHLDIIYTQAAARKAANFDHFVDKGIFSKDDKRTLTDDERIKVRTLEKGFQRYLKFHNSVYDLMDEHKIPQTADSEKLLIDSAAYHFKSFKLEDFVLYYPSVTIPGPGETTCSEVKSCVPDTPGGLSFFFFGDVPKGFTEYFGDIHQHNISKSSHPHCESIVSLYTAFPYSVLEKTYDKIEVNSPTFKFKQQRRLNKTSYMIDLGGDAFYHQIGIQNSQVSGDVVFLGDSGYPTLLNLGVRHIRAHHYSENRDKGLNTYYPDAKILG